MRVECKLNGMSARLSKEVQGGISDYASRTHRLSAFMLPDRVGPGSIKARRPVIQKDRIFHFMLPATVVAADRTSAQVAITRSE
jgi:hypothetical protein